MYDPHRRRPIGEFEGNRQEGYDDGKRKNAGHRGKKQISIGLPHYTVRERSCRNSSILMSSVG